MPAQVISIVGLAYLFRELVSIMPKCIRMCPIAYGLRFSAATITTATHGIFSTVVAF